MKNKIAVIAIAVIASSALAIKLSANPNTLQAKKKFTRCAAIRMKEINLGHLEKDAEKYTTQVPQGWTVVSGAGGEGHPKMLICQ